MIPDDDDFVLEVRPPDNYRDLQEAYIRDLQEALYSQGLPITVEGAPTDETQPCEPATEPTISIWRH